VSELGLNSARETARLAAQQRVGVAERSHEWAREALTDLADGSLATDDQCALEAHLATCASCTAFRRTYERTVELLQGLPPAKAPAEAKRRVLESLP